MSATAWRTPVSSPPGRLEETEWRSGDVVIFVWRNKPGGFWLYEVVVAHRGASMKLLTNTSHPDFFEPTCKSCRDIAVLQLREWVAGVIRSLEGA